MASATGCPGLSAACAAAVLFSACGGGGADPTVAGEPASPAADAAAVAPPDPGPPSALLRGVSRVVVAGDSLADVGTFGYKFTVQDASSALGFPLFPELVAQAYGLAATCSHYRDDGTGTLVPRGDPSCTNFAVAGSRLLRGDGARRITAQLRDAGAALGAFAPDDLVLVDGGGNDASDLAAAYLGAVTSRRGLLAFLAFLAREVEFDDLLATAPGDDSLARSALLYLEEGADALAAAIAEHVLGRGATRVAVLNLPDVTRTPRFTAAFEKIVQEHGSGDAEDIRDAVRRAVGAFNARLQARLGGDARVLLVDVRAAVDDQITRAADHGLSDAVHAACPVTGTSSQGMPEWSLPTCTTALLDAASPALPPGWWTTWAFADGFHPSPLGHRLLASTVTGALASAAW